MGLDQWARANKEGCDEVEIMTWRKHADLQKWMEQLFRDRGGEGQFNMVDLPLIVDNLNELEQNYLHLEKGAGFFWGETTIDDIEDTKTFIDEARKLIMRGWNISYTSWW
jgi:hypothetical protein